MSEYIAQPFDATIVKTGLANTFTAKQTFDAYAWFARDESIQLVDMSNTLIRRNLAKFSASLDGIIFGDTDNLGSAPVSWVFLNGNVQLGSTTDNGSKLQVTGNATLSLLKTTLAAPTTTGTTRTVICDANGLLSFTASAGVGVIKVTDETPAGLVNGANATYTTAFAFTPASVEVFINGLRQKVVTHFNTSGATTIILGDSPITGDLLQVNYERA